MIDDATLLRRFVEQRSEDAFAELVRRHLNLVYFAALRQTDGDTHRAEDAAQATFTLLAQKAASLLAHPTLAGWLHTSACHHARDLMRAEQRRLQREQTAHVMHALTSANAHDETWTQVRPIIDDALQDLAADDREAVLLRFFENLPFADIGNALHLGEDAARMRVTRALGQLETALGKRGFKSTATALAAVLSIPAAMAAPAGLATHISTVALSSAAIVGTGATLFTVFKIMSSAKLVATATGLAALVAIGTVVYQHQQLETARLESAALSKRQAALQTKLTDLEAELSTERKRAAEADADSEKLLTAAASAQIDLKKAQENSVPVTHDFVQARYKNAQDLARSGQYAEALKEFLWCYDTGMRQIASFGGVRSSYLLNQLFDLGKKHPPALAALHERRATAEQRMKESANDHDALMDYANLNRTLGENHKTLALFDSIPAGDERRHFLAYNVKDDLLNAQRYTELAEAQPYSRIARLFDTMSESIARRRTPTQSEAIKRDMAEMAAKDIEAFAGAGDVTHASELVNKLIALDNSTETRTLIQTHLTRAGHPELLK
jgi:RNA polymerase sigma factor (sigma-70 family)